MSDLISRQAAIDAMGERPLNWDDNEFDLGLVVQFDADRRMLEAVPSVDVQPVRHGRWETDGMPMDDGEYLMTRCTVCGMAYEYGHNENYCGYCGARMDGDMNDKR